MLCSSSYFVFTRVKIHTAFDKVCKEHVGSSTFCFHFGSAVCFRFWYRNVLPCFCHYALAGFEVFHKGVPKLQGSNLVLHWPRWSFSWNWWAISCQTFRLICFPLAASVSFIFKRGLGSLKLLCQLRAFWVLRIYLIFMLLQLHAYDNICKEHYYLQLCASILGALCASIVDTILRFQSRPSVLESFLSWILLEHVFFTLLMLKHP